MMKWKDIETNYKGQIESLRSKTPYELLGVDHGASISEVKKAYRKKMRLYHPDRTDEFMSDHGEEISKLLNQAVEQIKLEIGS